MSLSASQIVRTQACDWILDNIFREFATPFEEEIAFCKAFERLAETLAIMDLANEGTQVDLIEMVFDQYASKKRPSSTSFRLFKEYFDWLRGGKKSQSTSLLEYEGFVMAHLVLKYGESLEKPFKFQSLSKARSAFETAKNQDSPLARWGLGLVFYLHAKTIGFPERTEEQLAVTKLLENSRQRMEQFVSFGRRNIEGITETARCPFYYLACVSARQEKDQDALEHLTTARTEIGFPSVDEVKANPDFTFLDKRQITFKIILSESQQFLKERHAFYTDRKKYLKKTQTTVPVQALAATTMLSESTLMRDALSKSTLEVLSDQKFGLSINLKAFFEPIKSKETLAAEARLKERMELYGLEARREIPGDGNCQMYSLSDQLTGNINHAAFIRRTLVAWLRAHANDQLPNGATIAEFVFDKKWEDYCAEMARDKTWGDHLTLIAATEIFCCKVMVISSIPGENFIVEITPALGSITLGLENSTVGCVPSENIIMLSHFAEFHYGSIHQVNP